MLEIRELVIEARVIDDMAPHSAPKVARELTDDAQAQLIEQIVRRVLETLNEQRERL